MNNVGFYSIIYHLITDAEKEKRTSPLASFGAVEIEEASFEYVLIGDDTSIQFIISSYSNEARE